MVKCGHCKEHHETVAEVRACAVRSGSLPLNKIAASLGITTIADKVVVPSSALIDPAPLPNLESARYAVELDGVWKFYQIDQPQSGKWRGYTFVKVQAGDETFPIRDGAKRAQIITAIRAAGPEQAAKNYGHQLGQCSLCGRTLTNPESIEAGIGPICAGKAGW